ncbi:pectate lyase [Haloterrigena sp. SYSU A121-1]|uniref:Pectate lyase n=1 Tax=Haloterrigena gelatinilytica TaxID=2741724 RepID=A0A8J8GQM4_9EURY|nr:pectate lyase [Haloterrigena gelatinilytica]NUB93588.1 pectate lyase [Haloterrigena gelatinilytica]
MGSTLADECLETVRRHVDAALTAGRDRYGERETPLLADAIDPDAEEAVAYDARDVAADRRLSNVATQQEFLRTLVALSRTDGDERYRDAAVEIVDWFLEHLTDSRGLPYWGGHVAYDLEADALATNKDGPHELKFEYPFYDLFWEADPKATRRFVEAFWDAHVYDWAILDFNRHGDLNEWRNDEYDYADGETSAVLSAADGAIDDPWDRAYEGGDVFFWGDGLTFVNTGSDLYYAAGRLADLAGDDGDEGESGGDGDGTADGPLRWARNLARRYVETRQETGISGYQFSQHPSYCNGPEIRGDRAQYQFAPYIHGDHRVYEGTLFRPRPIVQRRQLELGERLGDRGREFTRWAVEELQAWREAAYRPERNEFEPMLTDGHSLEGFVVRREGYFGPKGRVIGPIEADADFLWTYATASRTTGDRICWRTARDIARGLDLGDIGALDGADERGDAADDGVVLETNLNLESGPDLETTPDCDDFRAVYALLELHRATGRDAYRDAAARVGETCLEARTNDDGLFVDGEGRIVLEDPVPLALLHLAAALRGDDRAELPTPAGDRRSPEGGV